MKTLPYSGIRILDFTIAQQGPVGTQMLADFGADVIKIEKPGSGDLFRGANENGCLYANAGGYSQGFVSCNRNKRSLTLDLKQAKAKEIVHQMVAVSDVVVANFRPGVMEKLGFGHEELATINPRIICAFATGYGLSGPDRDTMGQDMMAQCRAGLVRGNPPQKIPFNVVDQMGGTLLAMGIMVALAAREKTGRGQLVDSNLLNAALYLDTPGLVGHLNTQPQPGPAKAKVPNPTYALYQARDGRWVHIIDAFRDRPLERQCKALGIPESVYTDPRFAEIHKLTPETARELGGILGAAVGRFTAQEVVDQFKEQDMMAVIVKSHDEVFSDPQVVHNRMVVEAEHPVSGTLRLLANPIQLSDTPAEIRYVPPRLGEHNRAVLNEVLGISDAEIDRIQSAGVLG